MFDTHRIYSVHMRIVGSCLHLRDLFCWIKCHGILSSMCAHKHSKKKKRKKKGMYPKLPGLKLPHASKVKWALVREKWILKKVGFPPPASKLFKTVGGLYLWGITERITWGFRKSGTQPAYTGCGQEFHNEHTARVAKNFIFLGWVSHYSLIKKEKKKQQ